MGLTKAQKQKKKELIRGINNNTQSIWIWGVLTILFCWTILVPVIGIIGMIAAFEMRSKKKQKLVDLE